jgi:hypothetical protein
MANKKGLAKAFQGSKKRARAVAFYDREIKREMKRFSEWYKNKHKDAIGTEKGEQ